MRTFSVIAVPFIIVNCWFLAGNTGFAAESRSNWVTDAYQKNCPSVVFIQGDKKVEERRKTGDTEHSFNGMGTGVIIDERGYIITNFHVVDGIRNIQVTTYDQISTIGTSEHNPYTARLVAHDSATDLAVIKIDVRSPLRPIAFGRSHDLMPGESCIAIGNPYGYAFSLTNGIVSQINREVGVNDTPLVYRHSIQTNTEINPGNSGGPMINVNGEMIGINVAMRQGANGIAFAIPVDQVVEVAAKLIGERVEQQISHGLKVSQVEPSNYDAIKPFIIRVDSVESNSPAALAGIQAGDFLTGIGEYAIKNKLDFYRALLSLKPNEDTAFTFIRNKESFDVAVAVRGPRSGAFAQQSITPKPVAAATAPRTAGNFVTNEEWDNFIWDNFGVRYAQIPTQEYKQMYSQFVFVKKDDDFSDGGVLVKAVRSGSPAEQAGIMSGDFIVGIDGRAIALAGNMRWVMGKEWAQLQSENDTLQADVIRDNTHYHAEIPMK